jgi:hypothetical protein
MAIAWDDILDVAGEQGSEVLDILKPYLPVLARVGEDVYESFLKHLFDLDWVRIDELLYASMTAKEREVLDTQVYQAAFNAALSKYRNKELLKEILVKIVIRLAIKASTGGLL